MISSKVCGTCANASLTVSSDVQQTNPDPFLITCTRLPVFPSCPVSAEYITSFFRYHHHPSCTLTTMVQAIYNDTVIAESSDTVFVEGNHYFPTESVKIVLSISDTT